MRRGRPARHFRFGLSVRHLFVDRKCYCAEEGQEVTCRAMKRLIVLCILLCALAHSQNAPKSDVGRFQIVTVPAATNTPGGDTYLLDTVTGSVWRAVYMHNLQGPGKRIAAQSPRVGCDAKIEFRKRPSRFRCTASKAQTMIHFIFGTTVQVPSLRIKNFVSPHLALVRPALCDLRLRTFFGMFFVILIDGRLPIFLAQKILSLGKRDVLGAPPPAPPRSPVPFSRSDHPKGDPAF